MLFIPIYFSVLSLVMSFRHIIQFDDDMKKVIGTIDESVNDSVVSVDSEREL